MKIRQTFVQLHAKVQSKLPLNTPCVNEFPENFLNFSFDQIPNFYSRKACDFYCRISFVAASKCNCSTRKLGFELYEFENLNDCFIGNYKNFNETSTNLKNETKIPCVINRSDWISDFQEIFKENSIVKFCNQRCAYQCDTYSYVSDVFYEMPFRGSLECPENRPEGQLKLILDDFVEEYCISFNNFGLGSSFNK